MPHDRRTRRVPLALMALAGVAMSVGCMRSSNLRSSAGPLPELSPAGELHPDPGGTTPGTSSPTAAAATGPSNREAIAPPPRPAVDPGPDSGGPAATSSTGVPATSLAPSPTSNPAAPGGASPPPAGNAAASGTVPDTDASASPAPSGDTPGLPATSPTPLLDAEIRRAQTVTRQHFESIESAAPSRVVDPAPTSHSRPAPSEAAEPIALDRDVDLDPPLPPLAASARVDVEPAPPASAAKLTLPPLMPVDPVNAGSADPAPAPPQQAAAEESKVAPGQAATIATAEVDRHTARPAEKKSGEAEGSADDPSRADEVPSTSAAPTAEVQRTGRPPLEIAALRLCSRVKGFGWFEPTDPDALKPGRRILVYWEMTGLEYRARGDLFVSRLAAHLELRSESDGSVVWEQSPPTAEDVCPRRRRDYYASSVVEFPGTLEPGPYRLRLIQTDLVGNRAASREIPVTIVR